MNMTKESCSIMIITVPPFHTFQIPRLDVYSTRAVVTTRHETVVAFLP